ncbi:MAG TPA: RidA family protein [Bacteroidales bacterium]|nr:RidA family protein [Bacteroidales bacterium]
MKKIINSKKAPQAIGPYSQAVEYNGMLFSSGQIPIDPATGKLVEGNIKEQTVQVLKNVISVLEEAGMNYSNVVKTTVFLTDMANFKEMNEIYANCFKENPPARSTIAVKALPMNALVEIETVAIR